MTDIKTLQEDLGYVASAVRRTEPRATPSIFLLWALLVLPGGIVADLDPHWSSLYWMVMAPLGAIASWWLGRDEWRRAKELDRAGQRRSLLSGIAVGVAFTMFGHIMNDVHMPAINGAQMFLLVQGLCFTLMGVHRTRELIPAGMIMFVGCALLFTISPAWLWTSMGLILSSALLTGWLFTRTIKSETTS